MNEIREPKPADYLARAERLERIAREHMETAEEYLQRARKDRATAQRLEEVSR